MPGLLSSSKTTTIDTRCRQISGISNRLFMSGFPAKSKEFGSGQAAVFPPSSLSLLGLAGSFFEAEVATDGLPGHVQNICQYDTPE
jgi:hypothetical protein